MQKKSNTILNSICASALIATAATLAAGCNPNRSTDNGDNGSVMGRSATDTTNTTTTSSGATAPGNNSGISTSDRNAQQPGTLPSQQPGVLYHQDSNSDAGAARPGDVGPNGAENPPMKNPANGRDTAGPNGVQQSGNSGSSNQ